MKAEHGSRFSHVSHNAATILYFWDELVDFANVQTKSVKLQELSRQVRDHKDEIVSELQALASCWYLILSPLWIKLRRSIAHTSLQLIDDFTEFAMKIQNNSSLEPSLNLSNPDHNKFMNLINFDNQFEEAASLEVKLIRKFQTNLVISVQSNHTSPQLNKTIKKMLQAASTYMLKLSHKWIRDAIPDASVKFPFSNQVHKFHLFFYDLFSSKQLYLIIFNFSVSRVFLRLLIVLSKVVPVLICEIVLNLPEQT